MAKKIKLADLSKEEKNKLRKTAVYSLLVTFFVCVILVGCFACSQQTPSEQQNPDKKAESQRLYWTGILSSDTDWNPQANEQNDGVLCGFDEAMTAHTSYDESTGCLVIGFGDKPYIEYGNITLSSCEGNIELSDGSAWSVKFSEKNGIKYMTIVDSEGKTVYYDCK